MKRILPLILALAFFTFGWADAETTLTHTETMVLQQGPIETEPYVAGGVVGSFLGFGIGHAIQGRYGTDAAWMSIGQAAGGLMFLLGAGCPIKQIGSASCPLNGTATTGLALMILTHVWEIYDLWATPPKHNKMYRDLRNRLDEEGDETEEALNFFVSPVSENSYIGAAAGFTYRF
jgi:hypothetical protein